MRIGTRAGDQEEDETGARRARAALSLAAVLFSTGGAAIKLCALDGWAIAGLRSGLAALALLALYPESRRGWGVRTGLVGLAYAVTVVLFVLANRRTTAASAVFLQATAPLYLLVAGPLLLKESVRRGELVLFAVMGAGLALVLAGHGGPQPSAPAPAAGNALGLLCGISWAATVVGLRSIARAGGSTLAAVVAGNVLALALTAPVFLPLAPPRALDWAALAWLGVVQIALAYALLASGMRRVGALETSLLLLLEPVLSPLWAWLVHGERMGPASLAGGALILGAGVARTAVAGRRRPVRAEPRRRAER